MLDREILFVAASPKYGGTEKHLVDLIGRLDSTRHIRLSVVCTGEDVFSERLTPDQKSRIRVECVPSVNTFRDWIRLFRSRRPDIVVLVKSWTWCFPWYALTAAWLAGIRKRYVIAHLPPTVLPASNNGPLARLQYALSHRRLGLFCTETICVSEFIRQTLIEHCMYSSARTHTVRNGVSSWTFHPDAATRVDLRLRLGISDGTVCLICVASLVQQKRVDVLLEAIAKVLDSRRDFLCLIVGDGDLQIVLSRQAAALRITTHVSFEGFHADIRPYLQASDVFVLTSDTEGLPLSILEAMACGLPCIVTNVSGNSEAVMDGETGIVVPPQSPDAVARAILFMLEHPSVRLRMADAARARVCQHFNIDNSMARLAAHLFDNHA
ncbi:MAG TPA: glycosyltransferase [Bryobacteraceae bacterium]|nr:glycosyltransferase [Bryobacteraceae bacterium]